MKEKDKKARKKKEMEYLEQLINRKSLFIHDKIGNQFTLVSGLIFHASFLQS